VAAGAVESLAENASDSVVAPLFFFALFGLPGALAYRAINTADAMVGYRGAYEYLGKAAARLDDLANFIPARLCAALLLVAGTVDGLDGTRGWRILGRDGGKTASPNAGRPMAAMAGLLGVRLTKPGHYALGDDLTPPGPETIGRAFKVVRKAAYLACFLTGAALVGR
jgi:adenosylcobinamide-phosphate synthase